MLARQEPRRSTRVLVSIPIFVSGTDSQGVPFEGVGEAITVNRHGALIRTGQPLQPGMDILIKVPRVNRSQQVRVVWVSERDDMMALVGFGVELQKSENIWGIHLPPSDWQESAVSHTALPEDSSPIDIPAWGTDVVVRGMASIRMPFQENTLLCPVDENEATIHVRLVVDIGMRLNVIFPASKRVLRVQTSGVSTRRDRGKWKMWVKFSDPVRIVTS